MAQGRRSAVGLAYSFVGQGAQLVVQVAVFVALARLLAPATFGLVAASLVVINVALLVATAGLRTALVQLPEVDDTHLRTAFAIQIVLAIAVFGGVIVLAPAAGELFRMPELVPVLRVMAVAYLIRCLSLGEALLLRRQELRLLAGIELGCYAVAFGGVALGLAALGAGVWAVVAAHATQCVTRTAALWWAARPPLRPAASAPHARALLRLGVGSTMAQAADIVAWEGDNFVVGRWLGASALGFYERAYRLMIVPAGLFGQSLWNVLFPVMSRGQHDLVRLRRLFKLNTAGIALLTLPLALLLGLESQELVTLVLGSAWAPLEKVFQILLFALFFRASFYVTDSLIVATGHVYKHAARRGLFALSVVGGALVGQRWGLPGVATCVLVALGCNFFVMVKLSLALLGMRWRDYLGAYLPALQVCAVVGAVGAPVAALLRGLGAAGPLVALGTTSAAAAGVLGAVRLAASHGRARTLVDFLRDTGQLALRDGPPTWLVPVPRVQAVA